MKKFTVLLALLLGLLLVSCGAPMTPSAVTPAAEENGITLKTQFPVYAPDVPFIQFSITNNSGEMAEFGTEWSIERLEGDAWYSVPFKPNTAWTQPLYMLLDGGTASDTAHLSMLDHKFKDGTYRIVKEINDTFYTAEFAIGDSPVGGDSPYGYLPFDRLNKDYTVQDAEEDGVIMLSPDADLSRFFLEKSFGMGTELRYGTIREDGSLLLTSLTAEEHDSSDRIRYETTAGVKRYFAYVITDGENIALSAYPTWMEEDDTRMILDDLRGNSSILQTLKTLEDTREEQDKAFGIDTPIIFPAVFWSENGTKSISVYPDGEFPLEFGLTEYFDGGGSAGSMSTVDTPGMKAIRSAMWTGENTVMLICDVEDNSLSGMTGYVFYDTAEDKVLSYTQSQYEPIRQADGGILIPE